jgi:hypothetical protein
MQRVPADSSSIASIGYAPEHQVLELEFRQSGEVYQYFNVPAEEHTAFLAADSKGTTSTATSSPDSTVIIGFDPNRNSSAAPTIKCSLIPTWTSIEHLSHHPPSRRPHRTVTFLRSGGEPEDVQQM